MPFDFLETDIRDNKGQYVRGHSSPGPGRSSKYQEHYPALVEELTKLGCTDSQIVDVLGIANSTYYSWVKKYPAFSEAAQRGKAHADAAVVQALYKLAVGYTYTTEYALTREGKLVPLQKHVPPSLKAIKLWLRNRQPKNWKI